VGEVNEPIARSALTAALVDHLVSVLEPAVLVGRGTAPQAGGWTAGQPGVGPFTPYVTVKALTASIRQAETIGRQRTSWICNYRLSYSGARESACDDAADLGRAASVALTGPLTLGSVVWTLQKVDTTRLGGTTRNDSTDPSYWDVTDDVSLWLARSLTP
jgi:hypothetical protein